MRAPNCATCLTCGEVPYVGPVDEHPGAASEHLWRARVYCLRHRRDSEAFGHTRDEAITKAAQRWAELGRVVPA